jgi:hypothetical protein
MKNPGELYAVKHPKKPCFSPKYPHISKMDIPKMSIFTFSVIFCLKIRNFRI